MIHQRLTLLSLLVVAGVLSMFVSTAEAQKFTHYPVQPIYQPDRDIKKGDIQLVFVYSCMCPRSQMSLDALHEAAKSLKYYGIKTKSLEYYQTGFEYMKVANPIYYFPALVMYRSDGSKVRYHGVDPPSADSNDFVNFALDNMYAY